jgi:hypothetical protein
VRVFWGAQPVKVALDDQVMMLGSDDQEVKAGVADQEVKAGLDDQPVKAGLVADKAVKADLEVDNKACLRFMAPRFLHP